MRVFLQKSALQSGQTVLISGSKSESNRLLVLQKLFPELTVENLSDADDVVAMIQGLNAKNQLVNIHHAGTAMRFLTAYFALCQEQKIVLAGSERMHNRPIGVLVEALRALGAKIEYKGKEGYPPLAIEGIHAEGGEVSIAATISSQYITALLLVGSYLKKGLTIHLLGEITSRPYIEMTLSLLNSVGVSTVFHKQTLTVHPLRKLEQTHFTVEADWSSASYYYSLVALSPIGTTLRLGKYKSHSLQGDAALVSIYEKLGVQTIFETDDFIQLIKKETPQKPFVSDFSNTPDLAQTVVVTCFGLGLACQIQGLHTLKIKETDRLVALQNELKKVGGHLEITADAFLLSASKVHRQTTDKQTTRLIDTYQDHRMAMAFAPLVLQMDLLIEEAEVVSKSYPKFWKDLRELGILALESQ